MVPAVEPHWASKFSTNRPRFPRLYSSSVRSLIAWRESVWPSVGPTPIPVGRLPAQAECWHGSGGDLDANTSSKSTWCCSELFDYRSLGGATFSPINQSIGDKRRRHKTLGSLQTLDLHIDGTRA